MRGKKMVGFELYKDLGEVGYDGLIITVFLNKNGSAEYFVSGAAEGDPTKKYSSSVEVDRILRDKGAPTLKTLATGFLNANSQGRIKKVIKTMAKALTIGGAIGVAWGALIASAVSIPLGLGILFPIYLGFAVGTVAVGTVAAKYAGIYSVFKYLRAPLASRLPENATDIVDYYLFEGTYDKDIQ